MSGMMEKLTLKVFGKIWSPSSCVGGWCFGMENFFRSGGRVSVGGGLGVSGILCGIFV